jgi:hypothetical protein
MPDPGPFPSFLSHREVIIERMFDPKYGYVDDEILALANEAGTAGIPFGLDEMPPGAVLAAIIEHTDVASLSGHDRIIFLRAQQRMASHYNAGVYQAMAAVTEHMRDTDPFEDHRFATEAAAAEIRAALRLTRRATDTELTFALELRDRLPRVWAALAAGDVDVRRAKTIAHHTYHLTTATAHNVVEQIIELAPQLTTGQLAARLKRLCIDADPEEAKHRYETAVEERRLVARPNVDGTTTLVGHQLPPNLAAAAMARINHIAKRLRRQGDHRTIDQLRADIYLDILNGTKTSEGQSCGPRGVIDLNVDLTTLLKLTETPGELAGYGPVIADIARQVAADSPNAEWRYTVNGDGPGGTMLNGTMLNGTMLNGTVLNGTVRRRPTTAQTRAVEIRNPTCIFPGCRMPATSSDLDHTTPYSEGGATTTDNLAPLCRHDHRIRHRQQWTYQPLPNGDHQWTTKLKHTYTASGTPP